VIVLPGQLQGDWDRLDPRVRAIITDIERWVGTVRVTSLLRPGDPRSPHHDGRAADISVTGWLPGTVVEVVRHLVVTYPRPDGLSTVLVESPTEHDLVHYRAARLPVLLSDRATGLHLHVQVPAAATPAWGVQGGDVLPETAGIGSGVRLDRDDPMYHDPPASPAEETSMTIHPERLGWQAALPVGYHLDDLGQVRYDATGHLVCGWSGRAHGLYLLPLPWPDPATGQVRVVWIDRQSMREIRASIEKGALGVARGGLGGIARRLLTEGIGILLGRVLR